MSRKRYLKRILEHKEAKRRSRDAIGPIPPTKKIPNKKFKFNYRERPDYEE
jgi:hypothetical protein